MGVDIRPAGIDDIHDLRYTGGVLVDLREKERPIVTPADENRILTLFARAQECVKAGQPDQAKQCFSEILAQMPDFTPARLALGSMLYSGGDLDGAEDCYRAAIMHDPGSALAYFNRGVIFNRRGDAQGAIECFEQSLAIEEKYLDAMIEHGLTCGKVGQFEKAIASLRRAAEAASDRADVRLHLAKCLQLGGLRSEAAENYRQVIALGGDAAEANFGLASSLPPAEGVEFYRKAVELRPDFHVAEWNLGLALLLLGQFDEGWRRYESRRFVAGNDVGAKLKKEWTGQPTPGATILVRNEQGLGDTIQFARYLPMLKKFFGKVIFHCPSQLGSLLAGSGLADEVLADMMGVPYDASVLLLSLPNLLKTRLENIPRQCPYIKADTAKVEIWRQRMTKGVKNVGLVWGGNPDKPGDKDRSVALAAMKDVVLGASGIAFHSLQVGKAAAALRADARLASVVRDWSDHLQDFSDTAALIANLDLVISVDTAVAHLSGALGRKTWIMLPSLPDWRWMLDRCDSPWYPTVKLFRQKNLGDWSPVLSDIASALAEFERS